MKHLYYLLVAVLLIGCNQNDESEIISPDSESPIFYASIESVDSRTYLDEDEKMRWTKDDRITIFVGENYNREFAFTGSSGSTAGGFTQKSVDGFYTAEKVSANYAVYPYNSTTLLETEGYFQISMPSIQNYAEDSFGLNANTMVAVTESTSDMFLQFKNVCSYLRLALYGDDITVKYITLQGNNNEPLAGTAYVTPAFEGNPTMEWVTDATATTLKLDCDEGVAIGKSEDTATTFWLVVPPVTLENGFTVRVVDTNNKMYEKRATSQQVFTRNISKNMPALQVVCDQDAPADEGDDSGEDDTPVVTYEVPNNQIWYKTKYDFAAVLATETLTNANLRAHTYENGIGKLVFDNDVTQIAANAFDGLDPITHIWLPDCLKTLGDYAFRDCTGLTSIDLPESLTSIGTYAFYDCTGLTDIALPSSLTSIGSYAFSGCKGLTSIDLPESLTSIGRSAFSRCTGLTSIDLPSSLTSIGGYAFSGCKGLTSIDLPESLTSIGDYAFYNCTSLTSIDLPSSLTSIGTETFYNCTNLTSGITIPNGVTSIGSKTFYNCTGLASVDILEGVTSIGSSAFSGCTGLTDITIPKSVTSFGDAVFSGCTGVLTIHCNLPNRSNSDQYPMRGAAFSEVKIAEGVTSIGDYAFYYCTTLTSIDLPEGLTSIGSSAFYNCTSLTSITIPKSVTSFGDAVFSGCKGLTSITIPDGVTSIGNNTFYNCTGLTSITIPKSVTSFGDAVFAGCKGLTSITIPDGVTSIGYEAFCECTGLTSITIPNGVTSIGYEAFCNCTSLTSIYCRALTPPNCYSSTFTNVTATIYVPQEVLSAYQAASYWKNMNLVGYDFEE